MAYHPRTRLEKCSNCLRCVAARSTLPPHIRLLTGVDENFVPVPEARSLSNADVVVVEPSTDTELTFHGFNVNRELVMVHVYEQLANLSPELRQLAYTWYNRGVIAKNAELQQETAKNLIAAFPEDIEHPELVVAVLQELRAEHINTAEALATLKRLIRRPLGIVTYTFRYMPDGRPIYWPKEFADTVVTTSRELGLPIMEPCALVGVYGVAKALKSDMRHYRDEFLPILAEETVKFAQYIINGGSAVFRSTDRHTGIHEFPEAAASGKSAEPAISSVSTAIAQVNAVLVGLHKQRLADLGAQESGLFEHYELRLREADEIADWNVAVLAELICQTLPRFDSYHVLRAGLGELAFVLAAMGMPAVAYEGNAYRYRAIEAGLAALRDREPEIASRITIGQANLPELPAESNVLGIATHLVGYAPEEEDQALAKLSHYKAILIEPRIFLRRRPSDDEQRQVIEAVRTRGLSYVRELPGIGVFYCAKPDSANRDHEM